LIRFEAASRNVWRMMWREFTAVDFTFAL
jgi:hypothetical protein